MNHSGFAWVGGEIHQCISEARLALEAYAEQREARANLEKCLIEVHKVRGALVMLKFDGVVLLIEEMEGLLLDLWRGRVQGDNKAAEAMMYALVELPGYLAHVNSGNRDNPMILIDVVNELRQARGRALLSEHRLFSPNLGIRIALLDGRGDPEDADLSTQARRLRVYYQQALITWFRSVGGKSGVRQMDAVFERLEELCGSARQARLWWTARAVLESISQRGVNPNDSLRRLLGQLDAEIKSVADNGLDALRSPPPNALLKKLLHCVARSRASGERVTEVRAAFELNGLFADSKSVDSDGEDSRKASLGVRGRAAMAEHLSEQIIQLKGSLDQVASAPARSAELLAPLLEKLRQLTDTLGLLAMPELRTSVQQRIDALGLGLESQAGPDDDDLLQLANVVVEIEGALASPDASTQGDSGSGDTTRGQLDKQLLLRTVSTEGKTELFAVKMAIESMVDGVVDDGRTATISDHVKRLTGCLSMLTLPRAAKLLNDWFRYLSARSLEDGSYLGQATIEALADSVIIIELCLDAVAEGRDVPEHLLDEAENVLVDGVPLVDAIDAIDAAQDNSGASVKSPSAEQENVKLAASANRKRGQQDGVAIAPVSDRLGGFDEQLLEIFTAEAQEVGEELAECFPRWRENPSDDESRAIVRRAFHTLKGSGRMVGADEIGEFAWSIENMLNSVISGQIQQVPEVFQVVEQACAALQPLIDELRGDSADAQSTAESGSAGEAGVDFDSLVKRAHALAQGEAT